MTEQRAATADILTLTMTTRYSFTDVMVKMLERQKAEPVDVDSGEVDALLMLAVEELAQPIIKTEETEKATPIKEPEEMEQAQTSPLNLITVVLDTEDTAAVALEERVDGFQTAPWMIDRMKEPTLERLVLALTAVTLVMVALLYFIAFPERRLRNNDA